jgi:cell division protein ZapE
MIMPHRTLKVPERGMLDAYAQTLAARGYSADPAQRAAAERLQRLYTELLSFKVARRSTFRRLLTRTDPPRGVYFWGGVGRGKSFLMDCFYDSVPYKRKKRIHFHAFMQQVHRQLDALKDQADPMDTLAANIARDVRLLCFDEFHVSDIADAMILGRLLKALFARGVIFVMTSNYPPERLYPNGLQRDRFLPTIALMQENLDVLEVEAGVDYRLRTLEQVEIYHFPADVAAEAKMSEYFAAIDDGQARAGGEIEILGRKIPTLRRGHGVIWFDFAALCGGPRSQNDYLELAQGYHTVLISGIPKMAAAQSNEARRFTWLVDVFYDHKVKLIATAACEAEMLYTEGVQSSEFFRTVSRLTEMRSREYLALQHLAG